MSAAVTAATPMKSTATMESITVKSTAEASTKTTMMMVFTPKTAEKPAVVVGVTPSVIVGITVSIAVWIIPVAVWIIIGINVQMMVMMFLSDSSWRSTKHHDTC